MVVGVGLSFLDGLNQGFEAFGCSQANVKEGIIWFDIAKISGKNEIIGCF